MFLHGYGASKECFLPLIDHFSRFYRVTAFDFWGFGASDPLPAPWSVGEYAAQTAAFLRERGVVRPYVLAHSFGARVAIKLASGGDGAFEKALLTGAAGIILHRGAVYHAKVAGYRLVKKVLPAVAEARFGSAEYRRLSPVMRESYKKIVNEDLRGDAENVHIPVLLVYGAEDTVTPVAAGRVYASRLPSARLEVLPRCGHFAFLDDTPSFTMLAEEFFGD